MTRRVLVVTAILMFTVGLRKWLAAAPAVPLRQTLTAFPVQLGGWELSREEVIPSRLLEFLKADDYLLRTYHNGAGQQAQLFVAYYSTQRAGESMHSPKNCLGGWGWEPLQSDRTVVGTDARGRPISVNRYLVERDGKRTLLLYWYQAHGRIIPSEYAGKIYLVWDAVRLGRRDGAIVRITAQVDAASHSETASNAAVDLARTCLPYLPKFLPD
jgi:EpsI family protein